jgi:hypothetical protein
MGYVLIWIESLAAGLLLAALVTACAARLRRRLWQVLVANLAALLLLAGPGSIAYGVGYLTWQIGSVQRGTFFFLLCWVVALALGMVVVLDRGLRRQGDGAEPAARTWPRGRLAVGLGVAVVLAGITLSNMDLAMKVQLAAVRAEAGAKILALMPARVPDRDNAAPVYHEAFDALTAVDRLPSPWKQKAKVWLDVSASFDLQDKDLARFLQSQERGLALLRRAAAMPGCSFGRDYFLSLDLPLPELERFRRGAELLALDARTRAARGDARGALDDVAAIFSMARHANEPILLCLVISAAVDRTGVAALEEVLGRTAAPDLTRLALADVSYRRAVQRAIQMEEAALGVPFMLTVVTPTERDSARWFAQIQGGEVHWLASAFLASPFYRVFFLPDDLASYRRYMKGFQDLAGRPYTAARSGWENLERDIRAHRGGGILSGLLLPAAARCGALAARTDALHRLARLAIAAQRYRAKTGKLPARLEDLTPDYIARIPTDPFTAKPLRLKHDGKDLVLLSAGPDSTRDAPAWEKAAGKGEITFRLRGR